MPSVSDVINGVKSLQIEYKGFTDIVSSRINSRASELDSSTPNQGEARDIKRKIGAADQVFFDKQKEHGDVPVGRQLTLQEVVITFFLVSIVFFGIAITTHQFITTQSVLSALKVLATYLLLVVILISFVVRYA